MEKGYKICQKGVTIVALFFITFFLMGCNTYHSTYTRYDPVSGEVSEKVRVSYAQLLAITDAQKIITTTQTENYIRETNTEGLSMHTDDEAVKAITKGVSEAVIESIKVSAGIPPL